MKKLLYTLPEVFFIGMASYWILDNYTASSSVNYVAVAVIAVMLFQVILKKRVIGLASGIALAMFSFFMVLAVRSEYNDFPEGSAEGLKFAFLGEGLFLISIFIAGSMVFKYAIQKPILLPLKHATS